MSELAQINTDGRTVTLVGAAVNAGLIVLKFAAGVIGSSQALIADAVHSVSDLFTDAIVLFGMRFGKKEPDTDHPFGHARIETLASSFVGIALIATAIYLGIKSSLNIYTHVEYHPKVLALIGACVSIAAKEVLYHYTVNVGKRLKSQLIIANAWHHRSDSLSSVAVLLGVIGARIHPSWHVLDSFAALVVSFFIVKVGLEIIGSTMKEFIDTAPPPDIIEKIMDCTLSVDGVIESHDLRVRTSGGLYQMETHIVVDENLSVKDGHKIAKEVERCLSDEFDDLGRVIIHVDPGIKKQNPPSNS